MSAVVLQWLPVALAVGFLVGVGVSLYAAEMRLGAAALVVAVGLLFAGSAGLLDDHVEVSWDDLDDADAFAWPAQNFAGRSCPALNGLSPAVGGGAIKSGRTPCR